MIKVFAENNIKSDKNIELKSNLDNKKFSNFLSIITSKNNYHSEITFDLKSNRTFKGYYRFEDYKKLKKIVGEEKIMSIGLDPMVAAMNNIKVIDGYHTLYNLKYKLKFRKIIENELNKDEVLKDYYDNWGNRVYVFYNDKNNLDINFQEAKNIGAKYVLSSFKIQKKELSLKCGPCFDSKDLNLYEIL